MNNPLILLTLSHKNQFTTHDCHGYQLSPPPHYISHHPPWLPPARLSQSSAPASYHSQQQRHINTQLVSPHCRVLFRPCGLLLRYSAMCSPAIISSAFLSCVRLTCSLTNVTTRLSVPCILYSLVLLTAVNKSLHSRHLRPLDQLYTLSQNGRPLAAYAEEFFELSSAVFLDDAELMRLFHAGLDD